MKKKLLCISFTLIVSLYGSVSCWGAGYKTIKVFTLDAPMDVPEGVGAMLGSCLSADEIENFEGMIKNGISHFLRESVCYSRERKGEVESIADCYRKDPSIMLQNDFLMESIKDLQRARGKIFIFFTALAEIVPDINDLTMAGWEVKSKRRAWKGICSNNKIGI